MPIDMQRAPKIPVGRGPNNLERVEIEVLDNGYVVTCYHKPDQAAVAGGPSGALAIMGGDAKKYTFPNAEATASFVGDKLSGRPTVAKGEPVADEGGGEEAAAPPRRRTPVAAPDDETAEPTPDDEAAEY